MNFASDSTPGFWNADTNNWQPRLGFAYQLNSLTVLRGGWAIYTVPTLFDYAIFQPGYSQNTPVVATNDNGLTYQANLTTPWPNGATQPAGNSQGVNTFVGQNLNRFTTDVDLANPQAMRWAVSVQRELPGQWVVEAGYTGNKGYDMTVETDINGVPQQFLSTSNVRDTAVIANLSQPVTNPFAGLVPGTNLNTATIQRQQLLRPYPQFTQVQSRNFDGSSSFQSGQFRLEKRFTSGYSFLTTYTISRFEEQNFALNAVDGPAGIYEKRRSDVDVPHRIVVNGIWELPFGRGRKWGSNWNKALDLIAGGWNISAIYQWQTGRPLTIGNVYYNGDINALTTSYSTDDVGPAGVRHERVLLQRHPGGAAPERPAHPAGAELPHAAEPPREAAGAGAQLHGHVHRQALRHHDAGACAAPPRDLQRAEPDVLQQPGTQPDQRQLRHRDEPEQPAPEPADRLPGVLLMT